MVGRCFAFALVFGLLLCFCSAFKCFYGLSACSVFYLCIVLRLLRCMCVVFCYSVRFYRSHSSCFSLHTRPLDWFFPFPERWNFHGFSAILLATLFIRCLHCLLSTLCHVLHCLDFGAWFCLLCGKVISSTNDLLSYQFLTGIWRIFSAGPFLKLPIKARVLAVFVFYSISCIIKTTRCIFMAQELHDVQGLTSPLSLFQETLALHRQFLPANHCHQQLRVNKLDVPVSRLQHETSQHLIHLLQARTVSMQLNQHCLQSALSLLQHFLQILCLPR